MEAALILLAAAAAALALAWARERRLRREDADRGRRDLAEQRFRREAELKEQSQRTAALFDRMVEGLIVVDAAGRIRMAHRPPAARRPRTPPRGGPGLARWGAPGPEKTAPGEKGNRRTLLAGRRSIEAEE